MNRSYKLCFRKGVKRVQNLSKFKVLKNKNQLNIIINEMHILCMYLKNEKRRKLYETQ